MVVNHKINIAMMPVEKMTMNKTMIDGNAVVTANMNQLGYIPARALWFPLHIWN